MPKFLKVVFALKIFRKRFYWPLMPLILLFLIVVCILVIGESQKEVRDPADSVYDEDMMAWDPGPTMPVSDNAILGLMKTPTVTPTATPTATPVKTNTYIQGGTHYSGNNPGNGNPGGSNPIPTASEPTPTQAEPTPTPTPTRDPIIFIPRPTISWPSPTPGGGGGGPNFFKIRNLPTHLKVFRSDDVAVDLGADGADSANLGTGLRSTNNGHKIAVFNINLKADRNWGSLKADSGGSKAFIYYAGGLNSIPGDVSGDYSLYVPKSVNGFRLGICPGADSLEKVNYSCDGLYFLNPGQLLNNIDVTEVTDNSIDYWKISGLVELGGAMESNGYVLRLPDMIKADLAMDDWSADLTQNGQLGLQPVGIVSPDNVRIATMDVNFNTDLDWSGLTAGSDTGKAFFHFPGGFGSIPGSSGAGFTLYIPQGAGDQVYICPEADSLSQVYIGCARGYYLDTTAPNVSIVIEDGISYWKVSGLMGTGAMSILTGVKDTMSRLQKNTAASHDITFATNNGLLASTDNMTLDFADTFDFNGIALSDIQLFDDSTPLTLAANAGVSQWGVTINDTDRIITFYAPTSGSGYIAAASIINVVIGEGAATKIINPASAGPVDLVVQINNFEGWEVGTIILPIVDSDQVNVTMYINTYIHFDIDTGTTDNIDCAFDSCLIHSGGIAAGNYTVDLGELSGSVVNKSQSLVMHSDGNPGLINSVYFDLSTNAINGAVVNVSSANEGLDGPGGNLIASVAADGDDITGNSGRYGFTLPQTPTVLHGTIVRNASCTSTIHYCGLITAGKTVFDTNEQPVDRARVRMDLGAAAAFTNNPGTYTDTLTFVATATF